MANYNFTDGVRRALAEARQEALRMGHAALGTEHILLGLLHCSEDEAATHVLAALGIEPAEVREGVERVVRPGDSAVSRGELPYTSRAKKVLEFSMAEARERGDSYVGTEHILLALFREGKGIAYQVLGTLDADLGKARREVHRIAEGTFRVRIDDSSPSSIYEQIVAQVREAVATGLLKRGQRLPTVRRLADDLDIAPGTVSRAYGELERLGVVVTEGARGTWVAELRRDAPSRPQRRETLVGLLRPVAVAAYHLGASARELRDALGPAIEGIWDEDPVDDPPLA